MPIGIHPKDDIPFTLHSMTLEEEDRIFIFSDGLSSQFGGEKGEKFKTKRFQNLLIQNSNSVMSDLCENLENTLNNWRGNTQQTDDILIIGLKI
jgi:serine phosphatase RsbU (regulator of sigma subunit)